MLGTKVFSMVLFGNNSHKWCGRSELSNITVFTCKSGLTGLPNAFGIHAFFDQQQYGFLTLETRYRANPVVEQLERSLRHSYGLHLFNSMTRRFRMLTNDGSLLGELLKKNCPLTCELAGDEL